MYKRNKFRAKKKEVDGIVFDSTKEANYYIELKERLDTGDISELELQVPFVLIPKQTYKNDKGKDRVAERECRYIADFTYKDKEGNLHVIDTKGLRLPDYRIKKKLMLWVHKIRIEEI